MIIREGPGPCGSHQTIDRFDNGYGASVIRGGSAAYGGLELAVLKFHSEGNDDWSLCYDTPITNDVIGHLTDERVVNLLNAIRELPPHI